MVVWEGFSLNLNSYLAVTPFMISSSPTTRRVFVTVGSTKFDALVQEVVHEETFQAFRQAGVTNIVIQCGNSALPSSWTPPLETQLDGLHVEIWRFKPSLEEDISKADLVISHAG